MQYGGFSKSDHRKVVLTPSAVLCVRPQGYQVHIGFGQDGDIIIRAVSRGRTLQLIHRELFRSGGSWDLPGPLLEGCFHWL